MSTKRRAEWERTTEGAPTGDMVGFTHQSLFAVAGDEYEEAYQAVLKPPHRWGEWAAVFHPTWDQIVGYVRLNPKDWYTLDDATDEVQGPFSMKRRAFPGKTKRVRPGVYAVPDANLLVFTRDQAEGLGLNPEELP